MIGAGTSNNSSNHHNQSITTSATTLPLPYAPGGGSGSALYGPIDGLHRKTERKVYRSIERIISSVR